MVAYDACLRHLSSWSSITPRNLWVGEGVIVTPLTTKGGRSLDLFIVKSINANLLGAKRELCRVDHSNPPPLLSNMSHSI